MKTFTYNRFFNLIKGPLFLYLAFLIFGIFSIFSTLENARLEQESQRLQNELTDKIQNIKRSKNSVIDLCKTVEFQKNLRVSVLNSQGKMLCDSHFTPLSPPSFFDLSKLKKIEKSHFDFLKYKDDIDKKTYLSAFVKLKEQNNIYYVSETINYSESNTLDQAKYKILFLFISSLSIVFIVLAYRVITNEFALHKRVRRLISRLNSKGVHSIQPLGAYDSTVDEVRLVDRQINKTINTLKKITEAQSFEKEKLQILLDALDLGIVSINAKQEILFSNKAFNKICPLGASPGKIWEYFRDPDFLKLIEQTLLRQKEHQLESFSFQNKIGNKNSFQVSLFPVSLERNQEPGLMAIFTDQTQHHLWRKMRVDFVANISHEVRTPLTALKGYLELIKEDLPEHKFLDKMNSNINRLVTLFEDLLNLSIIESDRLLNITPFSPTDLTKEVFQIIKTKFNKVSMELDLDDQAKTVYLDRELLEQVLTNLIENIFKYASDSKKITVVWRVSKQNTFIDIQDYGPGIKPKHQYRVFERFYRTEKSRSQKIPGTGLGLSIVKNIIEKHEGTVYLETNLGKGSHFKISLPNYKESEDHQDI